MTPYWNDASKYQQLFAQYKFYTESNNSLQKPLYTRVLNFP